MRPLLFVALVSCVKTAPPSSRDPGACFAELATALAGDEMEGRGVGTRGLQRAADLLERRFRAAGFRDVAQEPFTVATGVALGADNALGDLVVEEGFVPLGFSSDGAFEGEIVFAGYGIRAPDLGYDDYAGLDVAGKVVLAMRYEPGEEDEASIFDGKRASRWSDLRHKAKTARDLGAAALILVSPARSEDEPDKLPPLARLGPTSRAGLPVLQVTRAVAEGWLGASLVTIQRDIDSGPRPASRALGRSIGGRADVDPIEATVANVVGVVPGQGALADEVVVVGAHYDHLGLGGHGSMRPDVEAIHNGADDNASGTAAMVCAAAALVREPPVTGDAAGRRTVVVVAFTAEEIGLGGSDAYTTSPRRPLEDTVAMVNLDMVGRVRDGQLQVLGTDSAAEWSTLLAPLGQAHGLTLAMGGDGYGPSDQTSFYEEKIPVVHLFSGAHAEYHTPDDDASTLNVEGGSRVVGLTADLLRSLVTRGDRLTYQPSSSGPLVAGDSRGYGAWLGTIPDYSAMSASEGGVLLSDVRTGGPADLAGLRGGDRIVGMAGGTVENLYDMTFVLRDHKPGETIPVVVIRDGAARTLHATLGHRSKAGGAHGQPWAPSAGKAVPELARPAETHLADLRQLTFGGENAEAYWSPDGRRLIFQKSEEGGCDQQFELDLTTGAVTRLSSGAGRTTCGYYTWPSGTEVIYATTEGAGAACPAPPDRSQGYVWPVYDSYELVTHAPGAPPEPWLPAPGYDAEATVCMVDGRVVFTSTRDGDLELYLANADGSGLRRLTHTPGYDGGAFFTPDCTGLVWRASRPAGEALADYQRLLRAGLVRPSALELFWMDLATEEVTQLTANGAANFGPYPLPDGSGVIFSSNVAGDGREFDLFVVPRAGGASEQITHAPGFDGFPMFSPDGQWLVFASNRATEPGKQDTNLFVARWIP